MDTRPRWLSDDVAEEFALPTGHAMFIRPGAADLLQAVLLRPRCTHAIFSCMGYKYCLPMTRLLLERAAPGEWAVEGNLDGRWIYRGETYEIHGTKLEWSDGRSYDLQLLNEKECSVEYRSHIHKGQLNKD